MHTVHTSARGDPLMFLGSGLDTFTLDEKLDYSKTKTGLFPKMPDFFPIIFGGESKFRF